MEHTVCRSVGKARLPNPLCGPQDHKVQALLAIEAMVESGATVRDAVEEVSSKSGIAVRTLFSYRKKTDFIPRDKWAAILAPRWNPSVGLSAPCHPAALERFLALSKGTASIAECYRKTCAEAAVKGWLPIPSLRTLRRELNRRGGVNQNQKRAMKRDAQPTKEAVARA